MKIKVTHVFRLTTEMKPCNILLNPLEKKMCKQY